MKSPEYVATVVSSYKKVLSQVAEQSVFQEAKQNLMQVFNRGGFTDAYHHGKQGKDMMCYEKPKHWGIYVGKVTSYDNKRYIEIDHPENVQIGDGIEIWNGENESPSTIVSEQINGKIGRITGNIHVGDKVYKTYDKTLMQTAKESYTRGSIKKQPVNVMVQIAIDSPISITINDFVYESDVIPEVPKKAPLTEEKIKEQFEKTGNTPFEIKELQIQMNEEIFLPISKINELRRNAFQLYEEHFLKQQKRNQILRVPLTPLKGTSNHYDHKTVSLSVQYLNEDLRLIAPKIDSIYVPLKEAVTKEDLFLSLECKKFILLPTITKNKYDDLIKKNLMKFINLCNGFVVSSICQLQYFKDTYDEHPYWRKLLAPTLIANDTLNTFNSYTIAQLKELGFEKVILSSEMTNAQINHLHPSLPIEVMVYGNQCVMTSEYCPIGSIVGGLSKNQKCSMPCVKNDHYYLRDRLGLDFRVISDNIYCQSQIFNCKITSIESKNIHCDSILIRVIDESAKEISHIIDVHLAGNKLNGEQYTNAHSVRPV